MSSLHSKIALVIVLACGSALGLAHGSCASAGDAPQVTVSYHDLDLSRPEGTQELYRRLQHAARRVCPQAPTMDLMGQSLARQCLNEALERAVQQVNLPQLLALHRAQSGAVPAHG
jgi:UrcA family protein